jgi:hypothetical protein
LRITATGAAQELISPAASHFIFHDAAGWLMMPIALGILWLELWVLSRILVPPAADGHVAVPPVGLPGVTASANGKAHKQRQVLTLSPPPRGR